MKNYSKNHKEFYLLNSLSDISVISDPFPHVVIENPISKKSYELLQESFPDLDYFRNGSSLYKEEVKSNKRYQMTQDDICTLLDKDHPWRLYAEINSSSYFLRDFLKIFSTEIEKYYPDLYDRILSMKNIGVFHRDKFNSGNFDLLSHVSADINSKVTFRSSVRGPHLDQPDKLYFALHYMKPDDDMCSSGGDLILWKHKDRLKTRFKRGYREIPEEDLDKHSVLKYGKNILVIGLNTIDSVHSVSEREKGANIRKFANIVSQVPFRLF